jgi:hypothetical protein
LSALHRESGFTELLLNLAQAADALGARYKLAWRMGRGLTAGRAAAFEGIGRMGDSKL